MDIRRLTIFTFIVIVLFFLASKYMFKEDVPLGHAHAPQREIERQLTSPFKTFYTHTQIDNELITNNEQSVMMIKDSYREKFEELQSKTNAKIDALLADAKEEYFSQIKKGEGASIKDFYAKYSEAGQKIEQETDKAFYSLYQELIDELERNGYSEKDAVIFEDEYNKQKKERHSQVLEFAISLLGWNF